ncbi:YfgM family protein [Massilia sp. TSP1-1-2]|uniref:YfgM family protein n=1 Tax=unclassified Massilia TaxID=2609279 RepID=UPI003CE97E74
MAYDLEEQEQLASLQAFWKKFGNLITWGLIAVLGAYAAYNYWNYHQRNEALGASTLYNNLQTALEAKDNVQVQRVAGDIQGKFKGSSYAQMSALAAAKSAFDAGDLKAAKAQLQWVAANGSDEYKAIAKLRLSGVLLDEKAYDEALALLATPIMAQFAGAVADRKGDVLVAQNKVNEARAAYLAALGAMDKKNPGRRLVEMKLEAIGGVVPADAAAAPKAAA